jgi:hypothetical protein
MCLAGAAVLAIVAITVVIIGVVAVPIVGMVTAPIVGVVAAPMVGVLVALIMAAVTVLGVEVVRLGHQRPRNASEYQRQQRSFLHCCWSPEFCWFHRTQIALDHHARVKIFRPHNDEAIPRKAGRRARICSAPQFVLRHN